MAGSKRRRDFQTSGGASKKDFIQLKGKIVEGLPAATFRVQLDNGQLILCHLSGKMRLNRIRLTPGDEVMVELSPYDLTKGRISFRL